MSRLYSDFLLVARRVRVAFLLLAVLLFLLLGVLPSTVLADEDTLPVSDIQANGLSPHDRSSSSTVGSTSDSETPSVSNQDLTSNPNLLLRNELGDASGTGATTTRPSPFSFFSHLFDFLLHRGSDASSTPARTTPLVTHSHATLARAHTTRERYRGVITQLSGTSMVVTPAGTAGNSNRAHPRESITIAINSNTKGLGSVTLGDSVSVSTLEYSDGSMLALALRVMSTSTPLQLLTIPHVPKKEKPKK